MTTIRQESNKMKKINLISLFMLLFSILASCQLDENYFQNGKQKFDERQNISALMWFTKALKENPQHPLANFYVAKILEKNKMSELVARDHYLTALEFLDDQQLSQEALHQAVELSYKNEQNEIAKELVDSFLEKKQMANQTNEAFLYLMGAKSALALNDKQMAREYAENGVKQFPQDIFLQLILGDIVNQEYKQYYLGLQHYQNAEKIAPENLDVILHLAFGYNLIGNYAKASHYLDRLLQLGKNENKNYLHYQKLLATRRWRTL